jgi:hypothetical protein
MKLESFQDVADQILPVAPGLTEDDVKDMLRAVARDPSAGPDILAAYQAAGTINGPDVLAAIWNVLQIAASVASIITEIGGAVALV